MIDDFFHFGSVPLRFDPGEVFANEEGVGFVAMCSHELLELLVSEDDEVGVGLEHLGEETQVIVETSFHVGKLGLHLATFDVPEACDYSHDWFVSIVSVH